MYAGEQVRAGDYAFHTQLHADYSGLEYSMMTVLANQEHTAANRCHTGHYQGRGRSKAGRWHYRNVVVAPLLTISYMSVLMLVYYTTYAHKIAQLELLVPQQGGEKHEKHEKRPPF